MFFAGKRKINGEISVSTFECRRDGLTIRGTEYRPKGEKLPAAIVSHGFMANQDTVREYTKILADMGYAAYCFDFCGGCVMKGKSDGKTTEMSVFTEVKDLKAVMDYVRSRAYTDPDRLLLMGCSQGGFVSALTAAELPKRVKKLVLFYPALCIPDDARAGKMMFARFDPHNIPDLIKCGPMKLGRCYAEDVIGMDPFEAVKGYEGDVLIVHGTKDDIVDVSYARKLCDVYSASDGEYGRKTCMKIIEGAGHGFSRKYDGTAVEELRRFAK